MKMKKSELVFLILTVVILAAALIVTFVGARTTGLQVEYYEFSIPVTYEEHGQVKTDTAIYCVQFYAEDDSYSGYYQDNGMPDSVGMGDYEDTPLWWLELEPDPGYLMGDPRYADAYAGGMPDVTIGYFDEEWNEYRGVKEAEPLGIKLVSCQLPDPIENEFTDAGVQLDHKTVGLLTAAALVILLLGILLVRKNEGVEYKAIDRSSRVFNWLLGLLVVPLMFAFGPELRVNMGNTPVGKLVALMAPVTALGICASVLLRRKGWHKLGMAVQFICPLLCVGAGVVILLVGGSAASIFLVIGIGAGLILALLPVKKEEIAPTRLDQVGLVTNILLIPVYGFLSLPFMLLGSLVEAYGEATVFHEILAWVIAGIVLLVPVICGLSLGLSARLRKKGSGKLSFLIQFAGFVSMLLATGCLGLCDLIPWISASIN